MQGITFQSDFAEKAKQFTNLYKIAIWHLKIWQHCYFGQSHHLRIEVFQIGLVIFVSVSLVSKIRVRPPTLHERPYLVCSLPDIYDSLVSH